MSEQQFAVVVPVKPPARGKSRLVGVADRHRRALAEAFALDTVTAALASDRVGQVLAVTDDVHLATALGALGCSAIPDGVSADLNGSLRQAAAEAGRRWPEHAVAALCADLPALRPDDLDAALDRAAGLVAEGRACFVADAAGVGTTLYCAPHDRFAPRFGADSRAAHLATGAVEIAGDLVSLRRDVDDVDDLAAAGRLGLGAHTLSATIEPLTQ
ncbi:2-phospho-L-lactate guanylyltransferase [Nocardioides sp.]|uniref:2-phospho-L-lactate guanylyltransferase n=1 Tax=Nocardioides sp. TaxID=35761 RepID=UPI00356538DC